MYFGATENYIEVALLTSIEGVKDYISNVLLFIQNLCQ